MADWIVHFWLNLIFSPSPEGVGGYGENVNSYDQDPPRTLNYFDIIGLLLG